MKPGLTIGVVAYCAEKEITDLFKSIEAQTVKPKEVILVVDFEGDSTIPVAEKFGAEVIVNKKGKIYSGRNTALKNCRTEFLAFTDSDCILHKDFVKNVLRVFREHPEIAGGTGRHPFHGKKKNLWEWIHYNRFSVETFKTGRVNGVIGANSYFRVKTLKKAGGWPKLPLMGAEDVCISRRLEKKGFNLWFDENIIVFHKYKNNLKALIKQEILMGKDIVEMLKAEKDFGFLWHYTLFIPVMFAAALLGLGSLFFNFFLGLIILAVVLGGSLAYLSIQFKSFSKAFPRWIARWAMIPFYSLGVLKGLL